MTRERLLELMDEEQKWRDENDPSWAEEFAWIVRRVEIETKKRIRAGEVKP